jgi:predicted component of type VI protein secretion system
MGRRGPDAVRPLCEQQTQPLPVLHLAQNEQETVQQRYRRLKAFSDMTGVRLLFVYRIDEKIRLRELSWQQPQNNR